MRVIEGYSHHEGIYDPNLIIYNGGQWPDYLPHGAKEGESDVFTPGPSSSTLSRESVTGVFSMNTAHPVDQPLLLSGCSTCGNPTKGDPGHEGKSDRVGNWIHNPHRDALCRELSLKDCCTYLS